MGSKTKLTIKSLQDTSIVSDNINANAVTAPAIANDAVTSDKISNGAVSDGDLNSTLNLSSKTITLPNTSVGAPNLASTLDLSSKTVTLPASSLNTQNFNIALLGFKKAVSENLTVFNLVDGVVDEFADESGVDNSASTNLNYCGTSDYYINQGSPVSYSAGFTMTTITEPDTSTAGTNPYYSNGTFGSFTVPVGATSASIQVWGAGGAAGYTSFYGAPNGNTGGGGGYVSGNLAVTPGQTLYMSAGEGGVDGQAQPGCYSPQTLSNTSFLNGGPAAGGLSGVFGNTAPTFSYPAPVPVAAPQVYLVAGSGGARGYGVPNNRGGGAGGGLIGHAGSQTNAQNSENGEIGGGGGSQTTGGVGVGPQAFSSVGTPGQFLAGGGALGQGGGAGYYGGGGGASFSIADHGGGGGGSSYYSHPQVSSGATEDGSGTTGGGTGQPNYAPGTNEGGTRNPDLAGENGYVLLTTTAIPVTSSTIISDPFTSTTVPTTTRIVLFEENVGTPSLNTDIIASVSRNGGTNFTTVTLTDSGYVTGSSGQRILTGQASISGQPSGQSMKWKLELANNTVKIHGVSLSWA